MCLCGLVECINDDVAGDAVVCGDAEGVAGVVVEPYQDFGVCVGGEPVVGEIGLPCFVGEFCLESDVGRSRSFLWCWFDQTGC